MKEFIICAAIKLVYNGKIYYGHRHPHCIEAMNGELSWTMNRQEIGKIEKIQGFVTNKGRFVDRDEGAYIWLSENPTNMLNNPPQLYSEDLY
jgi:hypothetical protein